MQSHPLPLIVPKRQANRRHSTLLSEKELESDLRVLGNLECQRALTSDVLIFCLMQLCEFPLTNPISTSLIEKIKAANSNIVDVFVFGQSENDIDIAVVLKDGTSRTSILEALTPLGLDQSKQENCLITFTPVSQTDLIERKSSFIKNLVEKRASDDQVFESL